MRFRKSNLILGLAVVMGAMFMIYLVMDTLSLQYDDVEMQKLEMNALESKLSSLENDLLLNQKTIDQIKDTVDSIRKEQNVIRLESKAIRAKGKSPVNKTFASIAKGDFEFAQSQPKSCDIRMSDVYEDLTFDNPDGGVWKQGWEIQYDQNQVLDPKNKLQVFIIPHSHCDPGWIKTFEKYYTDQTRHILNSMLDKLSENPKRKFIYAEVSFFSLWWNEQDAERRQKALKLLENGQLEIVTGGWVMNDEANSHYYAMMEQMITGHEWLDLNLNGYKPNNGWAIDPFGLSPTMAYLLKRMGFDAMLIQRTHYSVKKHLARNKDLEFVWRQHWDHEDTTDMMTHMMPFYSYDVPHTCGPDPKICCQFDFERLSGKYSCPWRVPPKAITPQNVAERAQTLLDQYRKKAELYKSNVLLIPLGDDFRYDSVQAADNQFQNYERLIQYINSNPSLNAQFQFGTLEDYFQALREASNAASGSDQGLFKTLSGDFFTYADRDDHYWSGYYTSRPFYKNMDRVLISYLRGAEILYSMMWAEMEYVGTDVTELASGLMAHLIEGRRSLSLFQHHDGVTGTAKDHVVIDYGEKMMSSINNLQRVMARASDYLLTPNKNNYKSKPEEEELFNLDDARDDHKSLPKQMTIQIEHAEESYRVVVFNSHARRRSEVVTVKVSNPNVRVYRINNIEGDDEEEIIPSQLSPVFDDVEGQVSNNEYYVSFLAQAKGFALQTYYIQLMRVEEGSNTDMDVAQMRIHNSGRHPYQVSPFEEVAVYETGDQFSLQNGYVKANFDNNGLLQSITTLEDGVTTEAKLEFIRYGTRPRGDKSGAYLFLPDGQAKPMQVDRPFVKIVEGKIISWVEVQFPFGKHKITLKSSPGTDGTGLEIENEIDVSGMNNQEVAMRISSNINSGDEFFTDLNSFQMIKRKRRTKIPLQANYYPVPSMTYIQDEKSRLTLASKQPLGGSSLAPGALEIMMDRRLMQDDNRGLFQGVTDNHVTPHKFFLLLERKISSCSDEAEDVAASYPSLLAVAARHALVNPFFKLIWTGPKNVGPYSKNYEPIEKDLACDIHVVSLRTMQLNAFNHDPSDETALVIHRQGFNGCYKPMGMTCSTNGGKISLEELFPELFSANVKQMSLSLLYEGLKVEKSFTVSIKPMEMYSFLLRR